MEIFWNLWCVRAFENPARAKNRLTQGLVDTPRILVSCQFQNSEIHVFMSIDMVCRLKRNTHTCTHTRAHTTHTLYTQPTLEKHTICVHNRELQPVRAPHLLSKFWPCPQGKAKI